MTGMPQQLSDELAALGFSTDVLAGIVGARKVTESGGCIRIQVTYCRDAWWEGPIDWAALGVIARYVGPMAQSVLPFDVRIAS